MSAPISNPGSTLEDLENDLQCLVISRYALNYAEQNAFTTREPDFDKNDPTVEQVRAWLGQKIAETENSIAALTGGMPEPDLRVSRKWLESLFDFLEWDADQDGKLSNEKPNETGAGQFKLELERILGGGPMPPESTIALCDVCGVNPGTALRVYAGTETNVCDACREKGQKP